MASASPLSSPSSGAVRVAPRAVRVLVADDERDAVIVLTALLGLEGYEARGVYNGGQVITMTRHFQPDVILLDITMPLLNGYEVARTLRQRYAGKCPMLIAVTAYSKHSDKLLAELAGFDHHFAKPYDAKALLEVLATITPRL
jgi:CheY-like chemotaxis protein